MPSRIECIGSAVLRAYSDPRTFRRGHCEVFAVIAGNRSNARRCRLAGILAAYLGVWALFPGSPPKRSAVHRLTPLQAIQEAPTNPTGPSHEAQPRSGSRGCVENAQTARAVHLTVVKYFFTFLQTDYPTFHVLKVVEARMLDMRDVSTAWYKMAVRTNSPWSANGGNSRELLKFPVLRTMPTRYFPARNASLERARADKWEMQISSGLITNIPVSG